MLKYFFILALAFLPVSAYAGCEFSTTPCSQDRYGNTYRAQQNLGGGYNTSRNGKDYSQTSRNLGGGYTTDYQDGSPSMNGNFNPYGSANNDSNHWNDTTNKNSLGR